MGDWTESKYHETRFGGMDKSVEPHTLDRDGGIMADEFNMMSRTQGLRTRKGWKVANDLSLYVSSLPGTPKSPLGLIPYIANITTVSEDDDDDDTGGDGGNGGVIGGLIDDGGDGGGGGGGSNPVSLTLTTPQAVVADVPFNISAAASAQYAGGSAHLEWDFQPDGQPAVSLTKGIRSGWSDRAWSAQATIWTADRTRTGVTATLKIGNTTKATKNMGYSVADMIPSLTSPVPYRQQFTFTVACKLGGATQTNYAGNGRGVAIRWQALDENGNSVSCHVSYSLTEWADGVGTYSARLTSVSATAAKLKVIVTYAGESQTAEATIQGAGLLRLPSSLHVYGNGGTMRINAVALTPSSLSVVAQVGGQTVDITDYLEMAADASRIDFSRGWEDNVWEHSVRAKSGASAATLTLKLMNGEMELASDTITIANALTATITAPTASTMNPGEDLTATATVAASGYTITRLPENIVEIQILDEEEIIVTYNGNAAGELELETVMGDATSGRYKVQVIDTRDETELASITVTVLSMKSMLAEAINERLVAKGEQGNYKEGDSLYTLWGGALAAMRYFANADGVAADGTYTPYTATAESTGIPDPSAEGTDPEEWLDNAYDKVCTAKSKSAGYATDMKGYDCSSLYRGEVRYREEPPYDPIYVESEASCKQKAIAQARWGDEDSDYRGWKAFSGGVSSKPYDAWEAYLHAYYSDNKIRCTITNPNVDVHADYYFRGYQNGGATWDSLGHTVAPNGQTVKLFQNDCAEGGSFAWVDAGNTPPALTCEPGGGYEMTVVDCIVTYGFKHQ